MLVSESHRLLSQHLASDLRSYHRSSESDQINNLPAGTETPSLEALWRLANLTDKKHSLSQASFSKKITALQLVAAQKATVARDEAMKLKRRARSTRPHAQN